MNELSNDIKEAVLLYRNNRNEYDNSFKEAKSEKLECNSIKIPGKVNSGLIITSKEFRSFLIGYLLHKKTGRPLIFNYDNLILEDATRFNDSIMITSQSRTIDDFTHGRRYTIDHDTCGTVSILSNDKRFEVLYSNYLHKRGYKLFVPEQLLLDTVLFSEKLTTMFIFTNYFILNEELLRTLVEDISLLIKDKSLSYSEDRVCSLCGSRKNILINPTLCIGCYSIIKTTFINKYRKTLDNNIFRSHDRRSIFSNKNTRAFDIERIILGLRKFVLKRKATTDKCVDCGTPFNSVDPFQTNRSKFNSSLCMKCFKKYDMSLLFVDYINGFVSWSSFNNSNKTRKMYLSREPHPKENASKVVRNERIKSFRVNVLRTE